MKVARIFGFIVLVVVVAYLWWLYSANQAYVNLPGLIDLPAGIVVALALLLGWLVGWLPARFALWRRGREIAKLRARVAELEGSTGFERVGTRDPFIPDGAEPYPVTPGPDYENL